MATRLTFVMSFIVTLFCVSNAQIDAANEKITVTPEIAVSWSAHGVSGIDNKKLRTLQDPSFVHFEGHYRGTSTIKGKCSYGQLIELWGEGEVSYLGTSEIGYTWCFDVINGKRVSIPAGDIISNAGRLHFMILEERPDVYHSNMVYQSGTISYGTGDYESASGAWDATLRIFRESEGAFEWHMHIYGWLDVQTLQ